MVKVGINGFGRIGRLVFRCIEDRRLNGENIEVVAINDPFSDIDYMKYQLKYDSVHGMCKYNIDCEDGNLLVNGRKIYRLSDRNPENLQWDTYSADYVVESTGMFTTLEAASIHLKGGALRVIISAPSNDAPMFVMGVNNESYNGEDVFSNASYPNWCAISQISLTKNCA